jgi:hypothetical protein
MEKMENHPNSNGEMIQDVKSLDYAFMTLSSSEMAYYMYDSFEFEDIYTVKKLYWAL